MAEPDTDRGRSEAVDADTLRALEERLERATRTAERLLAQAAAPGPDADVPPAGWRGDGDDGEDRAAGGGWVDAADAERLLAVLAGVFERVPSELQQRLVAALRELLLAVRALIDWCLERADRRGEPDVEVQDIPIL